VSLWQAPYIRRAVCAAAEEGGFQGGNRSFPPERVSLVRFFARAKK